MLLDQIFKQSELNTFHNLIQLRSKNSIYNFTNQEVEIISKDILTIVKIYPEIEKIWITGSYVHGGHVLPNDNIEYLNMRKYFNLKIKVSDRDYITLPIFINKIGDIDLINVTRTNKILVFDSGLNLFEKR